MGTLSQGREGIGSGVYKHNFLLLGLLVAHIVLLEILREGVNQYFLSIVTITTLILHNLNREMYKYNFIE